MSGTFLRISGLGAKMDLCSLHLVRFRFDRSPRAHRLIAYLPKFASIYALPGGIADLHSLEG